MLICFGVLLCRAHAHTQTLFNGSLTMEFHLNNPHLENVVSVNSTGRPSLFRCRYRFLERNLPRSMDDTSITTAAAAATKWVHRTIHNTITKFISFKWSMSPVHQFIFFLFDFFFEFFGYYFTCLLFETFNSC